MRSDKDNWDINTSVGSTALFVAAARALAGRGPEPLSVDPLAEVFVRAAGGELAQLLDGDPELTRDHPLRSADFGLGFQQHQSARTRYFDDYLKAAADEGIRQVVILAAGLDSRAYRLPWPDGVTVYELDRPQVLDFKRETLTAAGYSPTADRHEVAVDLREDWLSALQQNGFNPEAPTAWLVEGLLIYLSPEAQDQLFETIEKASAPGSQAAIEQMTPLPAETYETLTAPTEDDPEGAGNWARLIYNAPRSDAAQWFPDRGWTATRTDLADYLRTLGRPVPPRDPAAGFHPANINLVTVKRPETA
ncbi:SAM-dependent methyltransferase [Nocardia sp. NPDC088792]|uniref:SAM-dependent methyltransferase n=1 Tax=Nocardia sp. NPDC088792 TaxID=3364332 RepID=UPI00380EA304